MKETIKVIFCNQICELLKNETINVTRDTKALVEVVVASGLGDEEGFMAVI
jgi:hypothetical protein